MYIQHQNLYVVATTKKNANAALVFVFLHRLVQVRRSRGGPEKVQTRARSPTLAHPHAPGPGRTTTTAGLHAVLSAARGGEHPG